MRQRVRGDPRGQGRRPHIFFAHRISPIPYGGDFSYSRRKVPYYPTRKLTILAVDPSVKLGRKLLRTQIEIPNEPLENGPTGHRVHIIDYDSTAGVMYAPAVLPGDMNTGGHQPADPFEKVSDEKLLNS